MKERSYFWDNYKGLLILLVVFGHFIYESAVNLQGSFANNIFALIYFFHMPAFVFSSGYLSKLSHAGKAKAIVRLSLCYLLLNSGFALYYCLYQGKQLQLLTPYASAWYILCLIVWRAVIEYAATIKWALPASFAAAFLIGFWGEFSNLLALSRVVAFFPFFLMGYLMDQEKLQKHLGNRTKMKMAIGLLVSVVGAIGLFVLVRRVSFSPNMLTMQPYSAGKHIVHRGLIMVGATAAIIALMYVVPNVKIPLLTKIGRNSLLIYLAHRFVTFWFDAVFPYENYSRRYLLYAAVATVIVALVFGADRINKWFYTYIDRISDEIVNQEKKRGRRIVSGLLAFCLLILALPLAQKSLNAVKREQGGQVPDMAAVIDDSIVISFVGDLILLKDQVESAFDTETAEYNFDPMFSHIKSYLSESDFSIGVLEGPTAGGENGYSPSDYYDGAKFYLNFPDSFLDAVKNAGIDLVSTANNHLLDMGMEGAMRTLDVLDEAGLGHVGSYRNQEEKERITIVDIEGVKFAVLAYSWMVNGNSNEEILENYPYVTSILPDEKASFFPQLMSEIEDDFKRAEEAGADLIIVMPHMGTQFSHETDAFQDYWNKKFAELGADIILGDHAHVVQPIEQIGDTVVVNCPGHVAESYIRYNGDAAAIVEVYVDRETKKPTATAVIPLYTQEMRSGCFRAIPIYDILTQKDLYEQMLNVDIERISQVQELVTRVMLGKQVPVAAIQPRYFSVNGTYCEYPYTMLGDVEEYKDTELYKLIDQATDIVYIGDSLTNGSHNGKKPWYGPIMEQFANKNVQNISRHSLTTQGIIDTFSEQIAKANGDLYIIAVGMNDVRYRDSKHCAMTPQEYVERIEALTALISGPNPDAKVVFISPWITLENDKTSVLPQNEKADMMKQFGAALEEYAKENAYCYIDPNPAILEFFETHQRYQYTADGIHPNAAKGIDLYSWAVMQSGKQGADLLP